VTARPPFPFDTFVFAHRAIEGRRVRLGYALTSRSGGRVEFEESLELPSSLEVVAGPSDPAVARALLGVHLAAGASYWKTCIPRELLVSDAALTAEDAAFWTTVYTQGLGEFFYRNEIDPTDRVVFRGEGRAASPASAGNPRGPALLLWGGGKDSAVSHEVLAQAREPHELLSIGRASWTWVRRAAEVAGVPLHVAERKLDPKLLEMNAAGALNGHVPVSAYLAFAGVLVALLAGRSAVIASNEASASAGNAAWHGIDVNHQWSKSLAFERLARAWLARHLAGGPEYVSLLRPLSELRIVKAFATHPGYFGVATSCNANFRQDGAATRRWCLACAKCVFVSLMARPWLDDGAYHALFGGDPLADPANATLVEELLGIRGTKPFECVGTPEETIAALQLARAAGRSIPHGIMTLFADRIGSQPFDGDALAARVLARTSDHELSAARLAALDDYLDRH
jgi:UDP-N-acetyl-alpha-D-muramoyl-L-alanyl-L-glutamate epimerase